MDTMAFDISRRLLGQNQMTSSLQIRKACIMGIYFTIHTPKKVLKYYTSRGIQLSTENQTGNKLEVNLSFLAPCRKSTNF